jgi:hypothetical protein
MYKTKKRFSFKKKKKTNKKNKKNKIPKFRLYKNKFIKFI